MLATIRRFTKTWPARALFVLLVAAFGLWGVAGKLSTLNDDTAVARVGNARVEAPEVQRVYAQEMARMRKENGPSFQPTQDARTQMVTEAVRESVLTTVIGTELTRLGIVVPDGAVRAETFSLPAFQGPDGTFSRTAFLAALGRTGMDEASFIKLVRDEQARGQLLGAVEAGGAAPNVLVEQIFAFARETRVAAAVTLPIAAATGVPSPTEAQLRRFWTNHPELYATPELRRVKLVVLSPQTLASDMTVSDAEIANMYKMMASTYDRPELRSVQVVSAPDAAVAGRLASMWRGGAAWSAVQAAASAAGAAPIELAAAKKSELPDAALAATAFAAVPGAVSAPVKGELGWYVVKVTQVTPPVLVPLAQAQAEVRSRIGVLKAANVIDDRANKVEDALAGGGGLEGLPSGLGLAAAEGTLDAHGNAADGSAAPLPATGALRAAILAEAFKLAPGEAPRLEQLPASKEVPSGAYYAVTVQGISKPSQLAYEQVSAKVQLDWTRDAMRHAQETRAAGLLAAVNGGTNLATAAQAAGLSATMLPPVPRPLGQATPVPGVPAELAERLYALRPGAATMLETADGFMVAQLQSVTVPTAREDPIGVAGIRHSLDRSVAEDVTDQLVTALQSRAKVTVNQRLVQQIAQQPGG